MKTKQIAYWVTTGIVAFIMISGGAWQCSVQPQNVQVFAHLGYPVYFMVLLGVWKVLGGVALVLPRFPRLKEWAYAGILFDLTGAAISQGLSHDGAAHVAWPLALALLTVASWALRPPSRVLGVLFSAKVA